MCCGLGAPASGEGAYREIALRTEKVTGGPNVGIAVAERRDFTANPSGLVSSE
jgi:hypothetical protein